MSVAGGVANGLAVSIALQTAGNLNSGNLQFREFLLFSLCTAAFWTCKRWVMDESTTIVESVIRDIRFRIMKKLHSAQLIHFESMERGRIISTLSTDTMTISNSSNLIINAASSAVMLIFVVCYIAYLSKIALLITLGITLATTIFYLRSVQDVEQKLRRATHQENTFYENITGLLYGFKELKLNRRKSQSFFQVEMGETLSESTDLRISSGKQLNVIYMIGQTFLFVAIGGVLFILPQFSPNEIQQVVPLIAVILFAIGPLGDVLISMSSSARAEAAIRNIRQLEYDIDKECAQTDDIEISENESGVFSGWKELNLAGATFQYPITEGRPSFCLQPVNLTFRRGEVVFIVGGNGSGKSTFLKMLTGLYIPENGEIRVDQIPITKHNRAVYRELFSTIFSDYYLFRRLMDAPDPDPVFVSDLLRRMDLEGRTDIRNKTITNRDLSTGQRKRLALIATALEEKPILVLDEWAADQDPIFRRFFYETLLPDLKKMGRTIIAATHDDHYFHAADRVLKMEYGEFLPGDQHHSAFGDS